MEDLYNPEENIICPYNVSHHIRRCKMSFHLVKCRKSQQDLKMVPCDFNTTHLIPEPELQYHHQICPDKKSIESEIVKIANTSSNPKFVVPKLDLDMEDDWDHMDVPTYNPTAAIENRDVLRHLDVESGAKRKNFRMQERQRLSQLNKTEEDDEPRSASRTVVLPPHRELGNVTNIIPNRMIDLKQRLEKGANKVFQQN